MATNFGDTFLQSYMATQAQQAEQKRQMQQFQFQNFWNNAKQQTEQQQQQAALAQKALYDQGILANDKVKADAEASANNAKAQESMAGIYRQGGQDVQPREIDPTPTTLPGSPVLAMHTTANLPQGLTPAVPLQAAPPPNTITLQGKQIHIPTGAEQQQQQAAQAHASVDDQIKAGKIAPEVGQVLHQLIGVHSALGGSLNEAELGSIPGLGKPAAIKEGDEPLTADQIAQHNALATQMADINKIDPTAALLKQGATRNDLANARTMIGNLNSATANREQRGATAAQNAQNNAFREAMLANSSARVGVQQGKQAQAIYQPAVDSAERFNIMAESYEKAVKDGDQQAMLNLLANHIGMTMGLQKGARINQAIVSEAEKSRPELQGIVAHFDKDGYLSGAVLTKPQMQQMVGLGQSRLAEDVTKAKNMAGFVGLDTTGPDRTPSAATVNYYTAKAKGDKDVAKQLAAKDGWTIK